MPGAAYNSGSFKDPEGRVFEAGGRVFRTLSVPARERMETLVADGVLRDFAADGLLVETALIPSAEAGLDPQEHGATILEHARVPVVSYPYEWSFDMLRDGALLTLDLMDRCLEKDLILKDGTAYNVMPVGGRMRYIDVLSIDYYRPGQPWEGYSQFCQEFLFPLMLASYKGVDFRPFLRGALSGIKAADLVRLGRPRDWFRPGFLKHVTLQAMLARAMGKKDVALRDAFEDAKLSRDVVRNTVSGLRRVVKKLPYSSAGAEWIDYVRDNTYAAEERAAKTEFVRRAMDTITPATVADLGCNTGEFSLAAAAGGAQVLSLDIDTACINAFYLRLKNHPDRDRILPLVADLTNPSPAQGWSLAERAGLIERIGSDAFLALALVHHICITANVPILEFVEVLAQIAPAGVVEWVDKSDDMVQRLLRNRKDVFETYDWSHFSAALERRFRIDTVEESHGGRRKLCLLRPLERPGAGLDRQI